MPKLFLPVIAAMAIGAVAFSVLLGSSVLVLPGGTLRAFVLDTDRAFLPNAAGEIEEGHRMFANSDGFFSSPFPRSPSECHGVLVLYVASENPGFVQQWEKGFAIEFSGLSLVGTSLKFRNPQTGGVEEHVVERPPEIYDVIRARNIRMLDLEQVRSSGYQPWIKGQGCDAPS